MKNEKKKVIIIVSAVVGGLILLLGIALMQLYLGIKGAADDFKERMAYRPYEDVLQCLEDAGAISSDDTEIKGYCDVGPFGVASRDFIYQRKDGSYYYVHISKDTVKNDNGTDEIVADVSIRDFDYSQKLNSDYDPCNLDYTLKGDYLIRGERYNLKIQEQRIPDEERDSRHEESNIVSEEPLETSDELRQDSGETE